jgi:hypothetical protein
MPEKLFVLDESELTPEDFDRFSVWMNAHWFDEDEVVRKYGPFTQRRPDEASRIAYEGPLPYPLLDEDHPDAVVKCVATTAGGHEFAGYLTPLLPEDRNLQGLSPQIFASEGVGLCHGELNAAEQATLFPRWRADVERAFGRPLRDIFPVTLAVPDGILPPAVPSRWSLPGLMYLANWRPQVVPFA